MTFALSIERDGEKNTMAPEHRNNLVTSVAVSTENAGDSADVKCGKGWCGGGVILGVIWAPDLGVIHSRRVSPMA